MLAHPLQVISCTQGQKKTQQSDPIPATYSSTPLTKGLFQDSLCKAFPGLRTPPSGAPSRHFLGAAILQHPMYSGRISASQTCRTALHTTVKASRTESSHKCTSVSSHAAMFFFHASDSCDCCACTLQILHCKAKSF